MYAEYELRLPAIEISQSSKRSLYTFAVEGKRLHSFAAVSRLHRRADTGLGGYQRPEAIRHIAGIREYIESPDPLIPNAIVVAFDHRVRFEPSAFAPTSNHSRAGELVVPVHSGWDEPEKPGWIVDGQQRAAAIRDASVTSFPICVTGFIADSEAEQRTQFLLVNSTKPLPKGLINELLPQTTGTLPKQIRHRRLPARLMQRLNHGRESPLYHLINTPTTPEGVIKDNSMLRTLENSLSDGALYLLRDPERETGDLDAMIEVIEAFWRAVSMVFPEAWGVPPRRSRLMHGVGVISMGFVMDAICDRFLPERYPGVHEFGQDLSALAPACRWTSGHWHIGEDQRRWNEFQNTPRDIQTLTDHLLSKYNSLVLRGRGLQSGVPSATPA